MSDGSHESPDTFQSLRTHCHASTDVQRRAGLCRAGGEAHMRRGPVSDVKRLARLKAKAPLPTRNRQGPASSHRRGAQSPCSGEPNASPLLARCALLIAAMSRGAADRGCLVYVDKCGAADSPGARHQWGVPGLSPNRAACGWFGAPWVGKAVTCSAALFAPGRRWRWERWRRGCPAHQKTDNTSSVPLPCVHATCPMTFGSGRSRICSARWAAD